MDSQSRIWHLLLIYLGLMLLVVVPACGRPTPSSLPMTLPTTYLFADDFSPPSSAWARFDTEEGAVYALAGEMYLEDRGKGTAVYSPLVGHDYKDVEATVDVRYVQGTLDNWMGLLCRQVDEETYYLFAVSADGYAVILRAQAGTVTQLFGPTFQQAIRTGKAENALRIRCQGTQLKLWANDELVAEATDSALTEPGQVALFADAVPRGELAVVAFDNFILTEP